MASHLNRTERAIRCRGDILGLSRKPRNKTNEQFAKEFYSIFDRNEYILTSRYINYHTPIEYFHVECQEYHKSEPASLLAGHGCICKKANSNKVYESEFREKVAILGEGSYKMTDRLPFIDMATKVELLHLECGNTYKVKPSRFYVGRRCPYCFNKGNSKGERIIEKVLNSYGIKYVEQATFEGMVNIKPLYYDFLIEDKDLIIEYQGLQHYKPVEFLGGFNKFKSQVKRDRIKLQFAINNGYKLIEVPYTLDSQEKVQNFLKEDLLV